MAALTPRQLTLATLDRQHLLERSTEPWETVLAEVFAIQAQEPASPYLTLWSRVEGFDPTDLDAALADGTLVKCSAMRLTLHLLSAEDHPLVRAAMLPTLRAAALRDRRYVDTGLTDADADRFAARLADAAAHDPVGKAEIDRLLREFVGGEPPSGLWRALRYIAPLRHAADQSQPWSFARTPRFVAAPTEAGHEVGVAELIRRYLAAFGPASTRDIAQFTLLRQPAIRAGIDRLGHEVIEVDGPDGPLLDVVGAVVPADDTPMRPLLLPMWDSTLLAYADRSRIIPVEHKPQVIRRNGDTLPTVLVDGRVVGVWRIVAGGVEISAFEPIEASAWSGLATEAASVRAFVGERDTDLYGRFRRWWDKIEIAETRVV